MSSLKMHLAISNKLMENLKLGEDFLLGSIMPDLLKECQKGRKFTHFDTKNNNEYLPNIELYIEKYKNETSDLMLGYMAHLLEDRIWEHEYINKKYSDCTYTDKELYSDYGIIDEYIFKKYNLDINEISNKLNKSIKCHNEFYGVESKIIKKTIEEKVVNYPHNEKIKLYKTKDADEYFEKTYLEVKKVIQNIKK